MTTVHDGEHQDLPEQGPNLETRADRRADRMARFIKTPQQMTDDPVIQAMLVAVKEYRKNARTAGRRRDKVAEMKAILRAALREMGRPVL